MALLVSTLSTEAVSTGAMDYNKTIQCVCGGQEVLEVQVSNDDGETWISVLTFQSVSTQTIDVFATHMRIKRVIMDYTTDVVVSVFANELSSDLENEKVALPITGSSSSIETDDLGAIKTLYCVGGPNEQIMVEMSNEGTLWTPLTILNSGKFKQVNAYCRNIRATVITADQRSTPYLVIAASELGTGPNGDGAPSGGGGDSNNIIENDGELEGTYNGDVICLGDVSLTGDVIIRGDLIVRDVLSWNTPASLRVYGSARINIVDYDIFEITAELEKEFTIKGDLHVYDFYRNQDGNCAQEINIGGDLMAIYVTMEGRNGYNGINAHVGGDVYVDQWSSDGADSEEGDGADAGDLWVAGSIIIDDYYSSRGGQGENGGYGGDVETSGSATGEFELDGGNGYSGSGGNSGGMYVEGTLYCNYASMNGGNSYGSENGSAGGGGYLYSSGNITGYGDISLNGGNKEADAGSGNAGYGGYIYSYGKIQCYRIDALGGSLYSNVTVLSGHAGNGGQVSADHGISVTNDVDVSGGNATNTVGGAGSAGSIYAYDMFKADAVYLHGGNAYNNLEGSAATPGLGGVANFSLGCAIEDLVNKDGRLDEGDGGLTGNLSVSLGGNCSIREIDVEPRDGAKILAVFDLPVMLRTNSLANKTQFTNGNDTLTDDLSAFVATGSIFTSYNSDWFVIEGVTATTPDP